VVRRQSRGRRKWWVFLPTRDTRNGADGGHNTMCTGGRHGGLPKVGMSGGLIRCEKGARQDFKDAFADFAFASVSSASAIERCYDRRNRVPPL
jgi:hypothetical protein